LLKNFSKPVHLDVYDEAHASWTPLLHGGSCRRVRVGLQLEDRRGMASAEEITRFGRAAQQLAVELQALASALDAAQVARQSQALDGFCGEVDVQIALNVLCGAGPFTGTRLRDFAVSTGFKLEDDGRFRFRDEAGRELCALANAENAAFVRGSLDNLSTKAVTFELDVPRVPGGVRAFDACAAAAQQFAQAMGGQLADDNHVPLSAAGLAAIRAQLDPVYAVMEAQGVPAGSPQALRLFS
jgi:FtsZ-interacting cell division protein ZipA